VCAVFLAGCGASFNSEQTSALGGDASGVPSMQGNITPAAAPAAPPAAISKTAAAGTLQPGPGSAGYKIGTLDVVDVSVFKVPELSKSVQVSESGTINLPLVGEIPAAGKTAQEVEHDLTAKLGSKFLQNPQVTVFVKEYNSQRVTVEGAVKKPGVYPLRGHSSLLQFIATAEGLDQNADSTVLILRQANGKRMAARFDIDEIRAGSSEDPVVQAGDTIVAGTSAAKETMNNFLKLLPVTSVFALL